MVTPASGDGLAAERTPHPATLASSGESPRAPVPEGAARERAGLDPAAEREKAKLAGLSVRIAGLRASPTREALEREVGLARRLLDGGSVAYSAQLRGEVRSVLRWRRLKDVLGAGVEVPSVLAVLLGIACYALAVGVIGVCAVVVHALTASPGSDLERFLATVWLLPVFETVSSLGARPEHYLWGLIGGAGAVASIAKRIPRVARHRSSFWLLFTQGALNPVVGSLAAVVVVSFVESGQLNLLQQVPRVVVAFFAGFSERLLERVETIVVPAEVERSSPGTDQPRRGRTRARPPPQAGKPVGTGPRLAGRAPRAGEDGPPPDRVARRGPVRHRDPLPSDRGGGPARMDGVEPGVAEEGERGQR